MSEPLEACLTAINEGHAVSPYTRLIALGWYDGPEDGVVECAACGTPHRFRRLAEDWRAKMRVYGLAPLPPGVFEQVMNHCLSAGPPRWPLWVPIWDRPEDVPQDGFTQRLMAAAGEDLVAVLARNDLTDPIERAIRIGGVEADLDFDWLRCSAYSILPTSMTMMRCASAIRGVGIGLV